MEVVWWLEPAGKGIGAVLVLQFCLFSEIGSVHESRRKMLRFSPPLKSWL